VVEDPVANLLSQVQAPAVALEDVDDAERVLVMPETAAEVTAELFVERILAGVAEGRVPEVVAEPDCLDEILVQPERAGDSARDPGRLERVGQARAEVVLGRIDPDLGLVAEPAKRL
jgi:hypothetical protein